MAGPKSPPFHNMTTDEFIMLALAPLAVILSLAAWQDIHEARISNRVVLAGAILGIVLNTLLPQGSGFLSAFPGGVGLAGSLEGLALGFALLFPYYWLGVSGAGDVKLLAVVGAFLGPWDVFGATLVVFVAGGLLALVLSAMTGTVRSLLSNLAPKRLKEVTVAEQSVGNLPYAAAIAAGTICYAGWRLAS